MRAEIIIRATRTQNVLAKLLYLLSDPGCYGVLRFVMESRAKGCEVIVSGKLRAQRAKSMKFKDGYMISSGQPVEEYIDSAVRHVLLRQGVLGIKVKIMLDWEPKGKQGPKTPLPDLVTIHAPKDEEEFMTHEARSRAPRNFILQ
ncbi:40S ribosomal protein S3-1 [Ananas comosus]|uniref:40S ribosomal protein S3-1 n=2 Tax=Ananas comosus TaxID=4615 RepID=A0A199V7T0_ANACO|nr:40S ribosomal protein S3-1 [Ananas comosus]